MSADSPNPNSKPANPPKKPMLMIVAGFGIYNILNMMIYEKMNTIAILKATGFAGRDVQKIFLVIAMSIGFFGGLAGLILGFGLSELIDQIPFKTPSLPSIKTYPMNYNPLFYVIGAVFSLITTFLAGWFPSRKASKVDPVVVISLILFPSYNFHWVNFTGFSGRKPTR